MSTDARIIPINAKSREDEHAIRLEGISLSHCGADLLSLVSAALPMSGITGLLGPNGAGKSVLLRVIAGLVKTDCGNVQTQNNTIPAVVFQRPVLLRRSVRANLLHAMKVTGLPRGSRAGRLAELLVAGDLTRLAESPARALSGGEQQRLAIVRALVAEPKILLLDEPTASLDPAATHAIENLIKMTAARGVKILIVTHDRTQAARMCDDIVFLHAGSVAEHTQAKAFFQSPKSRAAKAYLAGELVI
jgi:tungstate transport system ATP-binding protein